MLYEFFGGTAKPRVLEFLVTHPGWFDLSSLARESGVSVGAAHSCLGFFARQGFVEHRKVGGKGFFRLSRASSVTRFLRDFLVLFDPAYLELKDFVLKNFGDDVCMIVADKNGVGVVGDLSLRDVGGFCAGLRSKYSRHFGVGVFSPEEYVLEEGFSLLHVFFDFSASVGFKPGELEARLEAAGNDFSDARALFDKKSFSWALRLLSSCVVNLCGVFSFLVKGVFSHEDPFSYLFEAVSQGVLEPRFFGKALCLRFRAERAGRSVSKDVVGAYFSFCREFLDRTRLLLESE